MGDQPEATLRRELSAARMRVNVPGGVDHRLQIRDGVCSIFADSKGSGGSWIGLIGDPITLDQRSKNRTWVSGRPRQPCCVVVRDLENLDCGSYNCLTRA